VWLFVTGGCQGSLVFSNCGIERWDQKCKVTIEYKSYPNAKHTFSDPDIIAIGKNFTLGNEYSKDADQRSWLDIMSFFNKAFWRHYCYRSLKTLTGILQMLDYLRKICQALSNFVKRRYIVIGTGFSTNLWCGHWCLPAAISRARCDEFIVLRRLWLC